MTNKYNEDLFHFYVKYLSDNHLNLQFKSCHNSRREYLFIRKSYVANKILFSYFYELGFVKYRSHEIAYNLMNDTIEYTMGSNWISLDTVKSLLEKIYHLNLEASEDVNNLKSFLLNVCSIISKE